MLRAERESWGAFLRALGLLAGLFLIVAAAAMIINFEAKFARLKAARTDPKLMQGIEHTRGLIGQCMVFVPLMAAVCTICVVLAKGAGRRRTVRWADPPKCHRCGYNLTGNESGRCPECGKACYGLLVGNGDSAATARTRGVERCLPARRIPPASGWRAAETLAVTAAVVLFVGALLIVFVLIVVERERLFDLLSQEWRLRFGP